VKTPILIAALLAAGAATSDCLAARGRVYVKQNAVGANDGTSWANAYTSLQDALAFASFFGGANVEVWVAAGTYKPTTGASRAASFVVPTDLYLYGGFAGTESTLAQRADPALNPTILSGAIGAATDGDNSFHVVSMPQCGDQTIFDGFTVTKGRADGDPAQGYDRGGGLVVTWGYPRIRNCRFIGNNAAGRGGAVWVDNLSFARFTRVLFSANSVSGGGFGSKDGGAVYTSSDGYYSHCVFVGNSSQGNGGAAYVGDTLCAINDSVFSGNAAGQDGGAVYSQGENVQLSMSNCSLSRNSAGDQCGGINVQSNARLYIYNCILWGNTDLSASTNLADAQLLNSPDSWYTLNFTTIQGGGSADPMFVDADGPDNIVGTPDDNLRLSPGSPAIDAGMNSRLGTDGGDIDNDGDRFEYISLDLDMNPRRLQVWSAADSGEGIAPYVDRGAYEFVPPPCVGDFNNDGQRNTSDLTLFLSAFSSSSPIRIPQDLDHNGVVNTADLVLFLAVFGAPCQ